MAEVSMPDVQMLLDRASGEGMVVSCYADTSLTAGFQSQASQRFKNEVARIEQALGETRARGRFLKDVAAIREVLDRPPAEGSRGVALFSAAERGLFQAFVLSEPVKDRLVLDETPYLVPLLELTHRQRRFLVVLTDTHHGALYAAAWGRIQTLAEISEPVPRRQRSAGETWGKQQATIARHREDRILHYLKALAGEIDRAWRDAPYRGVILFGAHETLEHLRNHLTTELSRHIVHQAPFSWTDGPPSVNDVVRQVLDTAMRDHDRHLVENLERRLQEHSFVAAGPQEVVNALRNGQVGYPGYLVLQSDRGQTASRCTRCESLFTVPKLECPYCGAACQTVNLWQEVLLFAARHGIPAHFVEDGTELARYGGIAAVLSRQDAWSAVGQ
jgi:peptide subunit release factor 1 (eRF1)